jgi:two-component system, OmpR family, osmolarity sensor histidine kinase EnvZ
MSWSQTALDNTRRTLRATPLLHPLRALKRLMPRRLFSRSLMIIVMPMILLQTVVTIVFFDRHYRITTAIMTRGVVNDVGYMVMLENTQPLGPERDRQRQVAAEIFGYEAQFLLGEQLTRTVSAPTTVLDRQLDFLFTSQLPQNVSFDTQRYPDHVDVRMQLADGVLRLLIPRTRVTASSADIFVLWMIGSSLVLIAISVLFLRNQVKPIERLASAAEAFGKGRPVPDFKPRGATEVRKASAAFIQMRERIDRFVQQRTDMLAGISHDLKTPLTRMRLQLAMMPKDADTEAMQADLAEMERMLNEYLEFARGEGSDVVEQVQLGNLATEAVANAERAHHAGDRIKLGQTDELTIAVRRHALMRCLTNLIDNALKYGRHAEVSIKRAGRRVEIAVDDDGPGIAEERREEAFRPFHRLDEGRNLQVGGVGLGLTIARDIARSHGGDILLQDSARGGLRAVIRLPI